VDILAGYHVAEDFTIPQHGGCGIVAGGFDGQNNYAHTPNFLICLIYFYALKLTMMAARSRCKTTNYTEEQKRNNQAKATVMPKKLVQ
jgi:hypothetical protein